MRSEAANAALSTRSPRAAGPPLSKHRETTKTLRPPCTAQDRPRGRPTYSPDEGALFWRPSPAGRHLLKRNFTDGSQPRDGEKRFDRTFFTPVPPSSGRPRPSHRSGGCAAGAPLQKPGTSRRHQRLICVGGAGGKGARFEVGRRAPAAAAAGETYKSVRCLATHGDALLAAGGEGCLRSITSRPKGRENEPTRCISQRPTQGPGDRFWHTIALCSAKARIGASGTAAKRAQRKGPAAVGCARSAQSHATRSEYARGDLDLPDPWSRRSPVGAGALATDQPHRARHSATTAKAANARTSRASQARDLRYFKRISRNRCSR